MSKVKEIVAQCLNEIIGIEVFQNLAPTTVVVEIDKDEKGIIMGEFGFVTGDGVYHVTKYATDENGNFRILSMKNFFIGLPGEVVMNMPLPTKPPPTTTTIQPTLKRIELSGIQGCSGCRIPTTTDKNKPANKFDQGINRITDIQSINEKRKPQNFDSYKTTQPNLIYTTTKNPFMKNSYEKIPAGLTPKTNNRAPEQNRLPESPLNKKNKMTESETPKPTIDPLTALLYEFNQTQTFQGHHERGYVDSSKEGDYFVNQRDGIKQIVEYIANENGYQPYIRFVNLTASETPDPETEKIRNMLQGMYFKWFYGKG